MVCGTKRLGKSIPNGLRRKTIRKIDTQPFGVSTVVLWPAIAVADFDANGLPDIVGWDSSSVMETLWQLSKASRPRLSSEIYKYGGGVLPSETNALRAAAP